MDLAIRGFTEKLISEINATALPIEVKRLVLKDICYQVEKTADKIIMQAMLERNEQLNKLAENTADESEGTTEK